MYDVMRLKRLIIKKKMFYVEINEKKKVSCKEQM